MAERGAPGANAATAEASTAGPGPAAFSATILTVYSVPVVRPVIW